MNRNTLLLIAAFCVAIYMLTVEKIAYFITRELPKFKEALTITEEEAIVSAETYKPWLQH